MTVPKTYDDISVILATHLGYLAKYEGPALAGQAATTMPLLKMRPCTQSGSCHASHGQGRSLPQSTRFSGFLSEELLSVQLLSCCPQLSRLTKESDAEASAQASPCSTVGGTISPCGPQVLSPKDEPCGPLPDL